MGHTKREKQDIQFQMGWGGLVALASASVCVLLWVFVLGFWVGQKLIGRAEYELHPTPSIRDTVPETHPGNREITDGSELPTEDIGQEGITETGTGHGPASQRGHAVVSIFALQIASYREKGQAEKECRKWRDKGYHVQIKRADLGPDRGVWYRVYLGQFHSLKEAIASSVRLAEREGLKSYVVPLGK